MNIKRYFVSLLLPLLFLGCQEESQVKEVSQVEKIVKAKQLTTLEKIKEKKRLDVIILNTPTVYYKGAYKELGFEYELISDYAKDIGVDLNLSVVYSTNEALKKSDLGDITVAGITLTKERAKSYKFGPKYDVIKERLVCHKLTYRSKTIKKDEKYLANLKITVPQNTTYVDTLKKLSLEIEGLTYETTSKYSSEQLISMVNDRKIDCTVVDSNIFMINQNYYPEVNSYLTLSDNEYLSWVLRDGDDSLKQDLYRYFNDYQYEGKMNDLRDFYYSYLSLFDYYGTTTFYKRLKQRLPKYEKYFKDAAKKYDVQWELLAAQSYQESHWKPKAKSHTGVRGMMMLTLKTAKEIGVKNRLDAKQSIYGGAKYLRMMEKRLPKEIQGKNRWAFTLAAYNVGMGHIHDAQKLARKLNKNPYIWSDIKKVLPLLSQKKYYKTLKYGYARGDEPVRYVDSILKFVNIIQKERSQ